jgi:hypothetical protein
MSGTKKVSEFIYKDRRIDIWLFPAYFVGDIELTPIRYIFLINGVDETIRALSTIDEAALAAKRTVDEWLS